MTFEPEPGALRGLPLARALSARGHQVRVITGFPQYPAGETYEGYRQRWRTWEHFGNVAVLRVPIFPSHDDSSLRRSATYLSFGLAALIIGVPLIGPADAVMLCESQPTNGAAGLALQSLRHARLVCNVADLWPESVLASGMVGSARAKRAIGALISRWCGVLYRRSDRVTAISPGFKEALVAQGVTTDKVDVIYNWADEDVFHPCERDPRLARALGLEGRFNVIYAGNLGHLQALETVLHAAHLLRDEADIQLVLIGSGPKEEELRRLRDELRLENLLFIDRRRYRDMPKIYALAAVLLVHLRDLPFLRATIPSKTQVSLASGRPVLMGARGDAASLITDAGAGCVCQPENPQEMAGCIRLLFGMPEAEREAMGARGREYYLHKLSLRTGVDQIEAVLGGSSAAGQ